MWWTPWVWITRMSVIYQPGLVLAPLERADRDHVNLRLHYQHASDPLTNLVREARGVVALDDDGQRRVLFHARPVRLDEGVAADVRAELVDDFADGRREDVDSAHDQHVVGAADAADARAAAATLAFTQADLDVIPGPEPQERRRAVLEVREYELAGGAVLHGDR